MKLLRSTLIFSAMTLLSRLAGYVRDVVQAGVFGASALTDAFNVAFRIPNLLRRLVGDRAFFAFSFGPFIGFWSAFEAAAARANRGRT